MQNFIESLYPSGSQITEVLVTLAILVLGIFLSKCIAGLIGKGLGKLNFAEKLFKGQSKQEIIKSITKLIYYILILNVLLIVLERLGVTSVLDPLKELANQFLAALPRIIGAGIIFYAGWIIAKLCASFVELTTTKLDDYLASKNLSPEFKISKFLSAFVFGGVLIPIVVSGLHFLNIKAISEPATSMIHDFMISVPKIVAAGLILLVSYLIGKFVVFLLTGLLEGMNVNTLPQKMGFASLLPNGMTLSNFAGKTVLFFIMLAATTAAIDKLDIAIISNIFTKLIDFSGGIVLGGVILLVGNFIANLAYGKLKDVNGDSQVAPIAKYGILGLVCAMGLKAMGLADQIVNTAFTLTLGSIAVSFAVSFGIGGIDAAKKVCMDWVNKRK